MLADAIGGTVGGCVNVAEAREKGWRIVFTVADKVHRVTGFASAAVRWLRETTVEWRELVSDPPGFRLVCGFAACVATIPLVFMPLLSMSRAAVQAENDQVLLATVVETPEQFNWAVDTQLGNILLHDTVNVPDGMNATVDGAYVSEGAAFGFGWYREEKRLVPHTETYSCGSKGETCTRTVWEWEWQSDGDSWDWIDTASFKGREVPTEFLGAKYEWLDPSRDVVFPEGTRFHGMDVSGWYVYETSHIRYSFKAARGGYDGTVTLHAGEGRQLSKVADFQRGKSVEEYRESYTSTVRAYIMPVIMEVLVLIVVCAVTYALVTRAAERS